MSSMASAASAADAIPAPIIGGSGNLSPKTPTSNRNGMDSRNISENIRPAISWDIPFQTNISTECNEIVPQRLILSTEPVNSIQYDLVRSACRTVKSTRAGRLSESPSFGNGRSGPMPMCSGEYRTKDARGITMSPMNIPE